MESTKSIELKRIRTDGGTQMRAAINNEIILDYRDKWKSGVVFNPIDIFFDGVTYWLADGFHRFYGAREAKRKDIQATIHNGSQREAILFACGANNAHGLRRTNADKRLAVTALLNDAEWSEWSNTVIAAKCGVHHSFVADVRNQLSVNEGCEDGQPNAKPKYRKGADGKSRRMPKKATSAGHQRKLPRENTVLISPNEPTAFDQLCYWWGKANATQKTLFRDHIDRNP